jgi:putative hydrolase of the HAD superfamily
MRTIRAVLFDLDDTLFDHRHCSRAALAGVRAGHACFANVDPSQVEASHARILEELHLEVMAGRVDLDVARVERFRRLYEWAGLDAPPELAARAAAIYRQRYLEARREVYGAAALLEALKAHARIAVVSNNLLDEQRDKLRHCGLDHHIDALVVSEEVGTSKPNAAIFRAALERVGAAADEAVMIGDSWANDIEGARAIGMRAIWFNRDGASSPDPQVPTIRRLGPVEEVLRIVLRGEDRGSTTVRVSARPR